MKTRIIYCKECGRPREVTCNNWKAVQLCKECAYNKRREYNSVYIKNKREKQKCQTKKELQCQVPPIGGV